MYVVFLHYLKLCSRKFHTDLGTLHKSLFMCVFIGSSNIFAYGSELHNSLTSEIRFLRKQNQALNTMLARGSRDKQKENEKLRESLSRKTANFEHLQQELACVKGENERLQKEASEKDSQNQQLLQELGDSRSELSR